MLIAALRFVWVLLSFNAIAFAIASFYHLTEQQQERTSSHDGGELQLEITSFAFNPLNKPPAWVERQLGSQAIHWGKLAKHSAVDFDGLRDHFVDSAPPHWHMPSTTMWPECSIEILAYIRYSPGSFSAGLHMNSDEMIMGTAMLKTGAPAHSTHPTSSQVSDESEDEHEQHVVGSTSALSNEWMCYYRAMRFTEHAHEAGDEIWVLPLYCPAWPAVRMCTSFMGLYPTGDATIDSNEVKHHLSFTWQSSNVEKSYFSISFGTYYDIDQAAAAASLPTRLMQVPRWERSQWAVCAVLVENNQSPEQIHNFIQHHARLGARILLYYSGSKEMNDLIARVQQHLQSDGTLDLLRYVLFHPWTIRNLFHAESNSAAAMSLDEELTFTHCRMEAKHQLGIIRTLPLRVNDFVFCPSAGAESSAHAQHFNSLLSEGKNEGTEQLVLPVHRPQPAFNGCKDNREAIDSRCLHEQYLHSTAVENTGLYLTDVCPLTGRRFACSPCESSEEWKDCNLSNSEDGLWDAHRSYDCVCNSLYIDSCVVLRLDA